MADNPLVFTKHSESAPWSGWAAFVVRIRPHRWESVAPVDRLSTARVAEKYFLRLPDIQTSFPRESHQSGVHHQGSTPVVDTFTFDFAE